MKDWLRSEGFNVDRVSPSRAQHAHRKMRVLAANITVPQQLSATKLKLQLEAKVADGEILRGEPCNLTVVVHYRVTKTGEVRREEVQVEGRKIPLSDLRKKILEEHEGRKFMKLHSSTFLDYCSMERKEVEEELHQIGEQTSKDECFSDLVKWLHKCHHTGLFLSMVCRRRWEVIPNGGHAGYL